MVLAEGTGTASAEVWLMVHGRLELAARWPGEPTHPPVIRAVSGATTATRAPVTAPRLELDKPGAAPVAVIEGLRHSLAVRERGELLGAFTVVVHDGQQLTPVEERLFAGLAAQSGLMLRLAGLRAELEQQLAALQRRTEELRKARRDLVTRQDAERQRLERNIHDGAQQEVIALLVSLRLAQTLLTRSPERGARLLAGQAAAARATIDTLTALSRGLYPRLLTDAGPVTALSAAVESGPIPVILTSSDVPRCAPDVEAAVYFSCLEAVQNASKHSGATRITIDIRGRSGADGTGEIELAVTDDGRGFDPTGRTGNGLLNISDRIECVRGSVSITSTVGHGTTIRARIPTAAYTLETDSGSARSVEDQAPGASRSRCSRLGRADMRVLGWLLFAATCVIFVLQGVFVAASNFPMTSYEVLVDQAFPLLGIGAIVGAGVGALIVSRYPRNLIGWLFLVGQLGSVIGLAAEAFRILAVQGVVTSPLAGQIAGYLHDVFGATFLVTAMAVIFMIAPDGRLLSPRWRLAVAVPIAALALRWVAIARHTGRRLPARFGRENWVRLAELVLLASFFLMLLSISLGAVALVLRLRRSTGQQRLQLRWISTSAAVLAVTFVLFALSELLLGSTPWILPEATCLAYIFFSVSVGVAIFRYRLYDIDVILSRAIVLGVLAVFVTVGYIVVVVAIGAVLRGGRRARIDPVLAVAGGDRARRGGVPTRASTRAPAGGSAGLRKPGRAVRGPGHAEPATRGQPITRRPAGQGRRGHRTRGRGRRHQRAAR